MGDHASAGVVVTPGTPGGGVARSHFLLGGQKKVSRGGLLWNAMSGGASSTKEEAALSTPPLKTLKRNSIRQQLIRSVISGTTNRRTPEQSPERCCEAPEVKPLAVQMTRSDGGALIDNDGPSMPSSRRQVSRRRGNRGDLLASAFRGGAGAEAAHVGGSFKLQRIVIKDGWVEACSQEPGRPLDVQDREWKRQFCVCQDGSLLLYESIKSTAPDVGVLAGNATIEDCCETELSSPLIIRVGGDGIEGPASMALKLPSVEVKHSWLSSIRQALHDSNSADGNRPRSWDGMGSTSAENSEHGIESCADTVPRGETEVEGESNEGGSVEGEGDQVGDASDAEEVLAEGFSALPSVDDGKGIHLGSLSFSFEETAQQRPSLFSPSF